MENRNSSAPPSTTNGLNTAGRATFNPPTSAAAYAAYATSTNTTTAAASSRPRAGASFLIGVQLPALQETVPMALAAQAEALPQRASATLITLAEMPRVCGIVLRPERSISWTRPANREAALAQTRGIVAAAACKIGRAHV